jgi:general secretion pathway protein K
MRLRASGRGFALLIVLWSIGLLSLVFLQINSAARLETRVAINVRSAAVLQAAADGAVLQAAFDTLARRNVAHTVLQVGGIPVEVAVTSLTGKLNPNTTPPEILAAALRLAGLNADAATQTALAIVAWRSGGGVSASAREAPYVAAGREFGPPGKPMRSVDELNYVLGVTPPVYAALAPHLSVFQEGFPNRARADPFVAQAMAQVAEFQDVSGGGLADDEDALVLLIDARARGTSGGEATRRAVVRLDTTDPDNTVTVLRWTTPDRAAS